MTRDKRRTTLKHLLAGAFSPLLPGCTTSPGRPPEGVTKDFSAAVADLQSRFAHEMQAQNLTGLSVAVVNDQQMTWTQGFGWADVAAGIPAGSRTVYRVGSISKLFTVAAALQFAEQGRLDLDAPIQRVLPEFRVGQRFGAQRITPRQLMTHHAGLPRDWLRGMWHTAPEGDFRHLLAHLANSQPAYPAGEMWSYSNLGLSVLGAAVERLAGVPFAEHLQTALLQPLGMRSASFSGPLPGTPALSKAYADGKEAVEPGLRDIAAGGLNASVLDLGRWLAMTFAQGRSDQRSILRADTVAEMLRVQNAAVPLDFDFKMGLGWVLTPPAGGALAGLGPVASHDGATINHRSLIVALPQHRLGVAILCNSANAHTLEQLAEIALTRMLEAKTGHRVPQAQPARSWQAATLAGPALADYAGTYLTPGGAAKVRVDGRQLRGQLPGLHFSLIPDEEGALHVRKKLFGLIPLPLGDLEEMSFRLESVAGRRFLVAQRGTARLLFGEKLSGETDLAMHPAWRDVLGTFIPEAEPGEFMPIEQLTLLEADGQLLLRPTLNPSLTDTPSGSLLVQTLGPTEGILAERRAGCGEPLALRTHQGEKCLEFAGITFCKAAA